VSLIKQLPIQRLLWYLAMRSGHHTRIVDLSVPLFLWLAPLLTLLPPILTLPDGKVDGKNVQNPPCLPRV
jgi:hypothetical protein